MSGQEVPCDFMIWIRLRKSKGKKENGQPQQLNIFHHKNYKVSIYNDSIFSKQIVIIVADAFPHKSIIK